MAASLRLSPARSCLFLVIQPVVQLQSWSHGEIDGLYQCNSSRIIEGITEFLPISSTGHLLIAEQWLGDRSDTFNVVIQAGAILAVTFIYWQRILSLLLGFAILKTAIIC